MSQPSRGELWVSLRSCPPKEAMVALVVNVIFAVLCCKLAFLGELKGLWRWGEGIGEDVDMTLRGEFGGLRGTAFARNCGEEMLCRVI